MLPSEKALGKRRCSACGETGHRAPQCPTRKTPRDEVKAALNGGRGLYTPEEVAAMRRPVRPDPNARPIGAVGTGDDAPVEVQLAVHIRIIVEVEHR